MNANILWIAFGVAIFIAFCAIAVSNAREKAPRGRYFVSRSGSTYKSYVLDTQTRQWLQRQIQVRVSIDRKLPEPITSHETGSLLHCTAFEPGSCGTGNLVPNRFILRDGYRVWQFAEVIDEFDMSGKKSVGIYVEWPEPGKPSRKEPLELFPYAALTDQQPGVWTEWASASTQRDGEFAWWSEVHGEKPAEPAKIEHPFQMRWRILLCDEPRLLLPSDFTEEEKKLAEPGAAVPVDAE